MSAPIAVLDIRPMQGAGNIRACLSIRIGAVTIHGCKIVQQPGQRAWLAMPERQWQDAGGKKHYSPTVELSSDLKKRVNEIVLAAWEARDGRAA